MGKAWRCLGNGIEAQQEMLRLCAMRTGEVEDERDKLQGEKDAIEEAVAWMHEKIEELDNEKKQR